MDEDQDHDLSALMLLLRRAAAAAVLIKFKKHIAPPVWPHIAVDSNLWDVALPQRLKLHLKLRHYFSNFYAVVLLCNL